VTRDRSTPTAVILAAGAGRRFGRYKPLVTIGDLTVIERVIGVASAVCPRIRIVGGASFAELEAHLGERFEQVELVRNEGWETGGMFSSVQLGLDGVEGAAFVHPADIPGPGPAVYRALVAELDAHRSAVLRPVHGGRPGHPVLLGAETVAAVRAARSDSTLREVLAERPRRDVAVDDELVLVDFDTPEDFAALARKLDADERAERKE